MSQSSGQSLLISQLGLGAIVAASSAIYLHLLSLDAANGWRPVTEFLVCMFLLFSLYATASLVLSRWHGQPPAAHPGLWKWVAVGAVLFRLILLPAGLPAAASPSAKLALLREDLMSTAVTYERFQLFDADIWRYLWDGHVVSAGINPYRFAPADPALDSLEASSDPIWTDIRDNIGYRYLPTIYPPLAQAFFGLSDRIAPGSLLAMKGLITFFDLAAAGLLGMTLRAMGEDPAWALLYAWNPLVVKVFAGSGHVDSLAIALLMAMSYCLVKALPAVAALLLGLAILVKLAPAILLPFFWRRAGARATAIVLLVVLLGYLPFLSVEPLVFSGLAGFAKDWQFNAGIYSICLWLAQPFSSNAPLVAKAACGLLLAVVLGRIWRRPASISLAGEAAPALGWLVLLSPAIMPWYTTWALPFAVVSRQPVWIVWTAIVCCAFFVMADGTEIPLILALEYTSLATVWLITYIVQQRKKPA